MSRRILHVMTRLPVGGVEHQLLSVIRHYDRARIEPLVCCLSDTGAIGREIEAAGVEVIALNKLAHGFRWSIITELKGIIKARRIEIVRTHQYHANFYGRLAAIWADAPCIVASVHNQYTRDLKPHRRLFNNLLARRTDALVAVSDAVKTDIIKYDRIAPRKVVVIPNGVDTDATIAGDRTTARAMLGIPADAILIGAIGRLTGQKGHAHLLEAFSTLPQTARLLLIGDGPLEGSLRARTAELKIADRVIFAGTRRDIPDMLAAMDIYAMPSLWEGLSNALIEAMAAARPMVASAIPSFINMLDHGRDALLVAPSDACALGQALHKLIADPALSRSMGEAARKKAVEQYGIGSTVERYTSLYESILRGHR